MNQPLSLPQASPIDATLVCPTCRAEQSWSDECRRCKSDLRDLDAVWRASRRARSACLWALRSGNLDGALRYARDYASLYSGTDAVRLLTVCYLHRGEWLDALRAAQADPGVRAELT